MWKSRYDDIAGDESEDDSDKVDVVFNGCRACASVERSGDGKVAGPVMCSLRNCEVVPALLSVDRMRTEERAADMAIVEAIVRDRLRSLIRG